MEQTERYVGGGRNSERQGNCAQFFHVRQRSEQVRVVVATVAVRDEFASCQSVQLGCPGKCGIERKRCVVEVFPQVGFSEGTAKWKDVEGTRFLQHGKDAVDDLFVGPVAVKFAEMQRRQMVGQDCTLGNDCRVTER